MKTIAKATICAAVLGMMSFGIPPAEAKGCIKGAVVGGLAGQMAGHGVLGAAGGCAVGHHMANKRDQERDLQTRQYDDNRPRQYDPAYR